MIDPDSFLKKSPFQMTHNDSNGRYPLANTTADLLKFQLQQQHRSKVAEFKNEQLDETINHFDPEAIQDSFNIYLQSKLDLGAIKLQQSESQSSPSTPQSVFSRHGSDSMANSSDEEEFKENETVPKDILDVLKKSNHEPNYLNLRILIENAVFDTSKIDSDAILSLQQVLKLKRAIQDKQNLHQYLLSKISVVQEFINDGIVKPFESMNLNEEVNNKDLSSEIETKTLVKLMKSNVSLQTQLLTTTRELNQLTTKLHDHNLSCLLVSYIQDVNTSMGGINQHAPLQTPNVANFQINSTPSRVNDNTNKIFDSLFAYVASMAAQRNIALPTPPNGPELLESKIQWVQLCINSILSGSKHDEGPADTTFNSFHAPQASITSEYSLTGITSNGTGMASPEKSLTDYRTALNDLRFSYQYLSKEYEHAREAYSKQIQDYRKKIKNLESEIKRNKDGIMSPPSTSKSAVEQSMNFDILESKEKEITKLRKELDQLRVDKISKQGRMSNSSLTSPKGGSPDLTRVKSPVTGELLVHDGLNDLSEDERNSMHSTNRPTSVNGFSSNILRKEFKKIVADIHDQYALELNEERLRRRQLQEELDELRALVR